MNKKEKLDIKIQILQQMLLDKKNSIKILKQEQEKYKEIQNEEISSMKRK